MNLARTASVTISSIISIWLLSTPTAVGQSPSAALVPEPTQPATYCIEVLQLDEDFVGDAAALQQAIISGSVTVEIVLAPADCSVLSDDGISTSDLVPVGAASELGSWQVAVKSVNGNAARVIQQENMFNDRAPRGQKIVMVTLEATNITEESRNVYWDLEWSLYVGEDQVEEYDGILPRDLSNSNDVPPGRRVSGTIAFIVPQDAPLSDLVLYLSDDYYAEFALE